MKNILLIAPLVLSLSACFTEATNPVNGASSLCIAPGMKEGVIEILAKNARILDPGSWDVVNIVELSQDPNTTECKATMKLSGKSYMDFVIQYDVSTPLDQPENYYIEVYYE